jgi:stage II sporulation protein D
LVAAAPVPVAADTPQGQTVQISAGPDAYLVLNGRRYRGPFQVTAHEDGLAVVETVRLDAYLEGIREVPFTWDADALKAQVVAARTYLAWTLSGGRSRDGRRIGYDICATAACQVYAGVGPVLGQYGYRWRAAVSATSGEILLYEGEPARAYYSSTTGGRTRNIEDIWPDSEPAPYLVGVPSTEEQSPFVAWSFELSASEMHRLLREAGVAGGKIESVTTRKTEDGDGPWTVEIVSETGSVTLDTWSLRSKINAAAEILPERLPATSPAGRVYPTTILSPEFEIRTENRTVDFFGYDLPIVHYVVEGAGWGHLIGMSQFGAQALASRGATYTEILAHYYGGLTPVPGQGHLPDQVSVGLVVGADSVSIDSRSLIGVSLDGEPLDSGNPGAWRFVWRDGEVQVYPPPAGIPLIRSGRV